MQCLMGKLERKNEVSRGQGEKTTSSLDIVAGDRTISRLVNVSVTVVTVT